MKATKKIVGAACALVAAVALSAGSTFAWFASNSSVSATNMKVQAEVPTNIYIEKGYKELATAVTQTTISFAEKATANLAPAVISTQEETGGAVTEGKGGAVDGVETDSGKLYCYTNPSIENNEGWGGSNDNLPTEGKPGTPSTLVKVASFTPGKTSAAWADEVDHDDEDYVATFDMTIANKSNATDIYVSVTITPAADTNTCLFVRTGMLVGTQMTSGGSMTYKFYSIENAAGTGTAVPKGGATLNYGKMFSQMPRDTVATISFLVWFDGNDAECTVNNASDLQEISFKIDFTTQAPGGPGA